MCFEFEELISIDGQMTEHDKKFQYSRAISDLRSWFLLLDRKGEHTKVDSSTTKEHLPVSPSGDNRALHLSLVTALTAYSSTCTVGVS